MSVSTQSSESFVSLPENPVGYLAILLAIVTGVIHLLLGPRVMGFSQTLGILFILNGLGFMGGIILYLTHYWRRELFLVAAGYALVTFLAFFFFGGFEGFVSPFYRGGELNMMAVVAKAAEVLIVAVSAYLYTAAE
ncbi:DUF7475 family protein [Haloplanus aerogenes]|uniref:Uncharacterized protein n=1 Tax=Haloplanus aerogenes TaxID=660522 RepID=A0A3M0CXA6_9EURY|nr:hypothetical protein [Haloplanus aerogenes]AZH24991.1 hypothetical protein DU502_06225 [Haloplanus aerogenes]RMB13792.1 hypothetical protein ATH50_2234 [Haloplanus aerogenes]